MLARVSSQRAHRRTTSSSTRTQNAPYPPVPSVAGSLDLFAPSPGSRPTPRRESLGPTLPSLPPAGRSSALRQPLPPHHHHHHHHRRSSPTSLSRTSLSSLASLDSSSPPTPARIRLPPLRRTPRPPRAHAHSRTASALSAMERLQLFPDLNFPLAPEDDFLSAATAATSLAPGASPGAANDFSTAPSSPYPHGFVSLSPYPSGSWVNTPTTTGYESASSSSFMLPPPPQPPPHHRPSQSHLPAQHFSGPTNMPPPPANMVDPIANQATATSTHGPLPSTTPHDSAPPSDSFFPSEPYPYTSYPGSHHAFPQTTSDRAAFLSAEPFSMGAHDSGSRSGSVSSLGPGPGTDTETGTGTVTGAGPGLESNSAPVPTSSPNTGPSGPYLSLPAPLTSQPPPPLSLSSGVLRAHSPQPNPYHAQGDPPDHTGTAPLMDPTVPQPPPGQQPYTPMSRGANLQPAKGGGGAGVDAVACASKTENARLFPSTTSVTHKYECQVCGKRFTRPSSLKTHLHVHTGERPFLCDEPGCGKSFSVHSNLRRHKRYNHPASTAAAAAGASGGGSPGDSAVGGNADWNVGGDAAHSGGNSGGGPDGTNPSEGVGLSGKSGPDKSTSFSSSSPLLASSSGRLPVPGRRPRSRSPASRSALRQGSSSSARSIPRPSPKKSSSMHDSDTMLGVSGMQAGIGGPDISAGMSTGAVGQGTSEPRSGSGTQHLLPLHSPTLTSFPAPAPAQGAVCSSPLHTHPRSPLHPGSPFAPASPLDATSPCPVGTPVHGSPLLEGADGKPSTPIPVPVPVSVSPLGLHQQDQTLLHHHHPQYEGMEGRPFIPTQHDFPVNAGPRESLDLPWEFAHSISRSLSVSGGQEMQGMHDMQGAQSMQGTVQAWSPGAAQGIPAVRVSHPDPSSTTAPQSPAVHSGR